MTRTMISYAQNAEDVLLKRAFRDQEAGFYIDAGANDPIRDSVTKHFYDLGWSGINIEPDEAAFARLQAQRPRDINLQIGLADHEGSQTIFEAEGESTLSTFSRPYAEQARSRGYAIRERTMRLTTLAAVCEEYVGGRAIDFLKIDVEGFERAVILGADWTRWRPRVVLAENNAADTWEGLLLEADYRPAAFDGINRFYVRAEEADQLLPVFEAPVNILDDYIPYPYHHAVVTLQRLRRVTRWVPCKRPIARLVHRLGASHRAHAA